MLLAISIFITIIIAIVIAMVIKNILRNSNKKSCEKNNSLLNTDYNILVICELLLTIAIIFIECIIVL